MTHDLLSVAVCTRNRAAGLAAALESLAAAAASAAPRVELLVVDNASTDRTAEVVREFGARLPMLRALSEPDPGLSHARNRALAEFRGGWLAFTDDDARVETGWLAALLAAVERFPALDYLGGRSLASWTRPPPRWLSRSDVPYIAGLLCHYDLGGRDRDYRATDPLPFGVNMAVSRRLIEEVGRFRTDLGPGTPARGEDTDYLSRARALGRRGRYLASATVHHTADAARLTLWSLYRHGVAKGRGHARMGDLARAHATRRAEAMTLLRAAGQGILGRGENLRVGVVNAGLVRGLREG